jgi:mycothiol synthase
VDPIVSLRPPADPPDPVEFDAIVAVSMAQDSGWWGSPDGDADDVLFGLDRAKDATGSLVDRVRLAVDDGSGAVIGVAMLFDHGQTNLVVDPAVANAGGAVEALLDWLLEAGGTSFESPAQDVERLEILRGRGIVPTRSGFELERSAVIDDLDPTSWPDGVTLSTFSPRVDDQEVHDLVYSVWTDVAGHTHRPIDEWRSLFVEGPWFDPGLVVMARRHDGGLAGVAICRTFNGDFGWVSQIAVGRPDRGVGLGRSLLVEALRRLAAVPGVANLGLSVEADNANALGLYRSVGLEVTREWVHCEPSE